MFSTSLCVVFALSVFLASAVPLKMAFQKRNATDNINMCTQNMLTFIGPFLTPDPATSKTNLDTATFWKLHPHSDQSG
jgi:hypothetical protein